MMDCRFKARKRKIMSLKIIFLFAGKMLLFWTGRKPPGDILRKRAVGYSPSCPIERSLGFIKIKWIATKETTKIIWDSRLRFLAQSD